MKLYLNNEISWSIKAYKLALDWLNISEEKEKEEENKDEENEDEENEDIEDKEEENQNDEEEKEVY